METGNGGWRRVEMKEGRGKTRKNRQIERTGGEFRSLGGDHSDLM